MPPPPPAPPRPPRRWSAPVKATDPSFFDRLAGQQAPRYLWIGCADSRVPANQILGLAPGEVFVQRNVGNLAVHRDMNCMACLEYAVDALKVEHVVVCGHYGCGAVKGALELPASTGGNVGHWISDIRATRDRHAAALKALPAADRWSALCELNVVHQLFNVATSPVVQAAWARGQPLSVHALIYSLKDGLLQELVEPVTCAADLDTAAERAEAAAARAKGGGGGVATAASLGSVLGAEFGTHRWFEAGGKEAAAPKACARVTADASAQAAK